MPGRRPQQACALGWPPRWQQQMNPACAAGGRAPVGRTTAVCGSDELYAAARCNCRRNVSLKSVTPP
eukprot:6178236-Pleurochrysis_carterae.AAC.3